jgi:magnesium chelatase subunit I
VTVTHVERVADAVLQHRRREGQVPSQEPATRDSTRREATGSESDWGYLPPEPTGMAKVKHVRPLAAKKA